MNNKIVKFTSFFITILVTFFVVLIFSFVIELTLLFKCENDVTRRELKINNLVHFATIEQLEHYLKSNPDDYVAIIKIAKILEDLGRKAEANKTYLYAIKVSSRANYALYHYAIFCAKNHMYLTSSAFAEDMIGHSKRTINYKGKIYEIMADGMFEDKEYLAATKAYQIAYKYLKNVEKNKHLSELKQKYAQSYIKLADQQISDNMIDEAIVSLQNSIDIKETPFANYKLGLIYLD